jgi:hypothetical protein
MAVNHAVKSQVQQKLPDKRVQNRRKLGQIGALVSYYMLHMARIYSKQQQLAFQFKFTN